MSCPLICITLSFAYQPIICIQPPLAMAPSFIFPPASFACHTPLISISFASFAYSPPLTTPVCPSLLHLQPLSFAYPNPSPVSCSSFAYTRSQFACPAPSFACNSPMMMMRTMAHITPRMIIIWGAREGQWGGGPIWGPPPILGIPLGFGVLLGVLGCPRVTSGSPKVVWGVPRGFGVLEGHSSLRSF